MAEQLAEYLVSAADYLAWESQQPCKYELIENRIYPMTGASLSHNYICTRLAVALDSRLSQRGCAVYTSDMRVQVEESGTYTYPDLVVLCSQPRVRPYAEQDTLLNPTLLFEILSPSTELIDRKQKQAQYLEIPSLHGYFLVSQGKPLIEAHTRSADDWRLRIFSGMDATLVIPAPDCAIPLREIYQQVSFADL
ncbi:MAG: Uma2 family endonuclease [Chloroflexota bacterium]|nr:Uma2 family endonuclease [Chloroflexota bacterium]MDE2947664.1 Uma2 family endonuclease [Chloroflexota bacterium]